MKIPVLVTAISITSLLLSAFSEAQQPLITVCSGSNSNYTTNSTYAANVDVLLGSLSSATNTTAADGFSTNITGDAPDSVFGLALCRGDTSTVLCGSCLKNAASSIQKGCPNRRSAAVWYDECFLRYSDQRFFTTMDSEQRHTLWNPNNITLGASEFNSSVWTALLGLAQYAAYNDSARPPRFAAGVMALGRDVEFNKLYGLVQCTRDISADDCSSCLKGIIGRLPNCCSGKRGGRVLAYTCNFRFEVYSFFNESAALTLGSPSTTPPPSPLPPQSAIPVPETNDTTKTNKSNGSGNENNAPIVAVIIPNVVSFILIILVAYMCFQKHKEKKKNMDIEKRQELSTDSLFFDLSTIKRATNNFSPTNKLGQGGFGSVYKGTLSSGHEIAVKRLSKCSGQGLKELKNEVLLLAKLQHRNLVMLLGLCLEGEEKLLLYEYVANKSLDIFLFDQTRKGQLNWERRYNIITGIARGLLYLHEESQIKIIHRDLKASNILLDVDLSPKISDFGLARLFGGDQTQACTSRVVGTFGYMSPEYVMRGHFSNKSDVFSFGVLVLEIVTGRRSIDFQDENATDLLSYVWDHWSRGSTASILDYSLGGEVQMDEALRCIEIGLSCVQESPNDRPTMSKVVLMLNSYSITTDVPTKPVFLAGISRDMVLTQAASSGSLKRPSRKTNENSTNEMTVTELEPR